MRLWFRSWLWRWWHSFELVRSSYWRCCWRIVGRRNRRGRRREEGLGLFLGRDGSRRRVILRGSPAWCCGAWRGPTIGHSIICSILHPIHHTNQDWPQSSPLPSSAIPLSQYPNHRYPAPTYHSACFSLSGAKASSCSLSPALLPIRSPISFSIGLSAFHPNWETVIE